MNRAARRRQAKEAAKPTPQLSQMHALGPRSHRRRALKLGVKAPEMQLLTALEALQPNQRRLHERARKALNQLRKQPKPQESEV